MTAALATHGTHADYKAGCRCDECREYQRARVAANRADRFAKGKFNHGRRSAYDAGCRCEPCRAARAASYGRERVAFHRRAKTPTTSEENR